MRDTFSQAMFAGMREAAPILHEIRVHPQMEGDQASYEREDGSIIDVEYQKASVEYSLKFEDARGLAPEEFLERARDIGRRIGEQMERQLFQTMSRVTDEVGNTVACDAGDLKFEQWLELNTKMLTDFDENGEPTKKTWVCSPEFQDRLIKALQSWERDPEKVAKFKAVMAKQKEAYDAREARRRLVE